MLEQKSNTVLVQPVLYGGTVKRRFYTLLLAMMVCQPIRSIDPLSAGVATLAAWGAIKGYKFQKKYSAQRKIVNLLKSSDTDSFDAISLETIRVVCEKYSDELFQYYCDRSNLKILEWFKERKIFLEILSVSSLHYACKSNDLPFVSYCLERGIGINEEDSSGLRPLDWAFVYKHHDLQAELILRGAEFGSQLKPTLSSFRYRRFKEASRVNQYRTVFAKDRENKESGCSPLHEASIFGLRDLVCSLLKKKVNVNEVFNKHKATALIFAAYSGQRGKLIAYWNKKHEPHDWKYPSWQGPFLWQYKELLQQKIPLNDKKSFAEIIEVLLNAGADINASNDGGWTALHIAAAVGNEEAVKILLKRGIDVEKKDKNGKTAKDWADEIEHSEIAKIIDSAVKKIQEKRKQEQLIQQKKREEAERKRNDKQRAHRKKQNQKKKNKKWWR